MGFLLAPGVGPITASAIVASVADAHQFNRRQFAAWLGLTPSNHYHWTASLGQRHHSRVGWTLIELTMRRALLNSGYLMFAVSSSRHRNPCLSFKLFSMAATGQSGRHDHETTVDHALIRGLVTAGPVIRRGASSV